VSYAINANLTCPTMVQGAFGGGNLSSLTAPAKTVMLIETAYTGTSNAISGGSELGGTYVSPSAWGVYYYADSTVRTDRTIQNAASGHFGGLYATGPMAGRTFTVATLPSVPTDAYSGYLEYSEGRHLSGANYLMADGHVKWLKGDAVSTGKAAASSTDPQDKTAKCAEGTEYSGPGAHAVTFSTK
jgi:prepilin-type processing-associated H-X9-DG protein